MVATLPLHIINTCNQRSERNRMTWVACEDAVARRFRQALFVLALSASSIVVQVQALAPPFSDWTTYENVHAERRRLNITYDYNPEHVSAEHCRYLSEELCEQEDKIMGNARQKMIDFADHQRRHLQMGVPITFPGNSNNATVHSPSSGDFVIPVLLIRFPEDIHKPLQPLSFFEEMFNSQGPPSDINPAGSVSQWLYYNTLGQYRATFDIHDWSTAPQSAAFYAQGKAAKLGILVAQTVFRWKLEEMDSQGFDWYKYDQNNDQNIDQMVVLHSGWAAEFGDIR
jgi:hypothetical protein